MKLSNKIMSTTSFIQKTSFISLPLSWIIKYYLRRLHNWLLSSGYLLYPKIVRYFNLIHLTKWTRRVPARAEIVMARACGEKVRGHPWKTSAQTREKLTPPP